MTNPSDYDYQGAMRIPCEKCGEQAQYHRLTPAGCMYCLKLRRDSSSWYKLVRYSNPGKNERRVAMNVGVRELVKGRFPDGLGLALRAATTSFVISDD